MLRQIVPTVVINGGEIVRKINKGYQNYQKFTNSYQMLPKVTNCCQKFLYLWTPMNHYHNRLQGGHFVPGQYVSWDNMSPSCTGTICLLGQYVPFLNSKIMSNRGTFCPGDVLSRDNICPGTICPGTKCPQTELVTQFFNFLIYTNIKQEM